MKLLLKTSPLLLLLLTASCRKADLPDTLAEVANKPPPKTEAATCELLPPPEDVAVASCSKRASPSHSSPSSSEGESMFVAVAKLAEQQDRTQEKVEALTARSGEFLPVQKDVKELRRDHDALAGRTRQIEARLEALEKGGAPTTPPAHQLPQMSSTPPTPSTPSTLPAPATAPAEAVVIAEEVKEEPAAPASAPAVVTPAPVKAAALDLKDDLRLSLAAPAKLPAVMKFTPDQQRLRRQVRETYESVMTQFPTSEAAVDAAMGLASLDEEEQNWPGVIDAYAFVTEKFPDCARAVDAKFGTAKAMVGMKDYAKAYPVFISIADTWPKHTRAVPSLISAAECQSEMSHVDEAVKQLRAIERSNIHNSHAQAARVKLAQILSRHQRYKDAAVAYQKAIESAPPQDRLELQFDLADLYIAMREPGTARDTLLPALSQDVPKSARTRLKNILAAAFESCDDPLSAARLYAQAAEDAADMRTRLQDMLKSADCYTIAEMNDHAAEQAGTLLKLTKDAGPLLAETFEPRAMLTLAKAKRLAGDDTAAAATLAQLRKQYPQHELTLDADLEDADVIARSGKVEEAVALYRQVIRRGAGKPIANEAILRIAALQDKMKGPSQQQILAELASVSPEPGQAARLKLRRALSLMNLARTKEAQALLKELLGDKNTPADVVLNARYQQAIMAQRAGDLPQAIGEYTAIVDGAAKPGFEATPQLDPLIQDAKWKISKLKWISGLQKESASGGKAVEPKVERL